MELYNGSVDPTRSTPAGNPMERDLPARHKSHSPVKLDRMTVRGRDPEPPEQDLSTPLVLGYDQEVDKENV